MNSNTNHDMIEELAASLDRAARIVAETLSNVQAVDSDDLVTELLAAPNEINQELMDALSRISDLGREAADLHYRLSEMGV